ncbi:hypothetical protein B0F90DRAFT_1815703 [Multifurca ochricompacta]|uniref:UspA domain-containing protein n=1 Tax=Multifurca ochricompacta TaxID=376703 RepID=A0AAD4M968_9AGAM|nr:hypothetical protein B0F90DRAFT_1815703 [Multifurca ochricompacta]
MAERQRDQRPSNSRRISWRSVYGGGSSKDKEKDQVPSTLVSPQEGVELLSYASRSLSSSAASLPSSTSPSQQPPHVPASRTNSISENSSPASSRPTTPLFSRWSSSNVLTKQQTDSNGLERTTSRPDSTKGSHALEAPTPRTSGSFGRMSFSSMMGGLSSLALSRSSVDDSRGRSHSKSKGENGQRARSSSNASRAGRDDPTSVVRSRSTSPFHFRRSRTRDSSPNVGALAHSDVESDTESTRGRPRSAYASDDESQGEGDWDNGTDSDEEWSDNDQFDSVTEANTERNALVSAEVAEPDPLEISDPLGEGVNVVVPPEPYFPTTLNLSSSRNPRRRKSARHEPLPLQTGRPVFQRDRCTISLTQGDPARALRGSGRRPRRYVVASDLSDESRYAVEWGIGTVLRDGDEISTVDPPSTNAGERATKLRSQQERQGLAYILCRQATSLLQRTRLNVTISCEAWHAKNARHMILDIIDYVEPVMLIVGSRGVGQLKGILLGSTSHYLIQKCSVPVMVARRRLKRPPRRSAHLAKHRARVSLAEAAGVERVTQRVDEEVAHMRDQIERSEDRESERMRVQEEGREGGDDGEGEPDAEVEGSAHGPARSSSMMSS